MTKISKLTDQSNSLLAGVINILKGRDSKEGNVRLCLMRKMEGKNKQSEPEESKQNNWNK